MSRLWHVCMCMCVHVSAFVSMLLCSHTFMNACMHFVGQKTAPGVLPSCHPRLFTSWLIFKLYFLTGLELTKSALLAGKSALGIRLSLISQCYDYKGMPLHLAFHKWLLKNKHRC